MRRIRHSVAMSLDGYIAGPNGEVDWIVRDPEVDFGAMMDEFDTLLVGRRTWEIMKKAHATAMPGMKTLVVSRKPLPDDDPAIAHTGENVEAHLDALRRRPGKDIWLFGGGVLFRSLAEARLVDTVEVAVIPILLGGGTPLLPTPSGRFKLALNDHKVYKTGIVSLKYSVTNPD